MNGLKNNLREESHSKPWTTIPGLTVRKVTADYINNDSLTLTLLLLSCSQTMSDDVRCFLLFSRPSWKHRLYLYITN